MRICVNFLYGCVNKQNVGYLQKKCLFINTDVVVCFYTHQNKAYNDLIYVCLEGHVDKGSCPTSYENIL